MAADIATTWQMWATMVFIAIAIVSYCYERYPLEITSIALIAGLLVFFSIFPVTGPDGQNLLGPGPLLSGYGNPALVAIIALLVVGQGLFQTGAFEAPTRWLLESRISSSGLKLLVIFVFVMLVSAFLNNTPVVVMFIPIVSALATQSDKSVSYVMMPLSFLCVLGGMTTLIGSSTNLLVADTFSKLGSGKIGFFEFTTPGLVLMSVGAIYVLALASRILPARKPALTKPSEGRQFIAQIDLDFNHPLVGAHAVAGLFPSLPNMTVRMVQRGEKVLLPPFDDLTLRPGDTVIVAATRKALTNFLSSKPEYLHGVTSPGLFKEDNKPRNSTDNNLIEAVISPGSRMVGRTLAQIGFHYQTNCDVLAVQRRSRMIRTRMNEIRLESGDVLLIFGKSEDITALRSNRDILLLEWSTTELPAITHANRARFIFAGVIVSAALGLLPIVVAAVFGAMAMIATGCLNIRQATRAVDRRIFLLIGTALALGLTLQETGGATYLAMNLVDALSGQSVPIVLSAFFLFVAIMTNVLSNNATAVLMTPIAVSAALQLGADPRLFVYTVIFAANCSFATPIAYQTNLLVMGPGHYMFADFVRFGLPLIVILWLTYTFFAPWYFGLSW